jgi:hypothetical protein
MVTNSDYASFSSTFCDDIVYWVSSRFEPEDVFSETILDDWAVNNGYIKQED